MIENDVLHKLIFKINKLIILIGEKIIFKCMFLSLNFLFF